jgi:hypothetical protein
MYVARLARASRAAAALLLAGLCLLTTSAAGTPEVDNEFPARLRVVPSPATAHTHGGQSTVITVTIWGQARSTLHGNLQVNAPSGWVVTPANQPFALSSNGVPVHDDYTVSVTAPAGADLGSTTIGFVATDVDNWNKPTATAESTLVVSWPAGTTAVANTVHPANPSGTTFLAAHAIDGNTVTFWNDNTDGGYPDILTITAPSPQTLGGVTIIGHSAGSLADFTVQTSSDGQTWTEQARVTGNTAVTVPVSFQQPVTATQVRLTVTLDEPSSLGVFTRIAEFTPEG